MGFFVNTASIPYLGNYKRAKIHHDNITPIRGRTLRPIGDRRKQHMTIEETQHEGVHGIACVLYHTKVVTYFEDGRIRLDSGGYCTQSTVKFMQWLLPAGSVTIGQRGHHLRWHVNGSVYKIEGKYDQVLWLRRPTADEPPQVAPIPINPLPFIVHAVDRVAMKAVKAKYAPFIKYAVGMGRLTEWARNEDVSLRSFQHRSVADLMTSGELDDFATAFKLAVTACGRYGGRWDSATGRYDRVWVCHEAAFRKYMLEFIKRTHHTEVFVKEALPIGQFKLDSNIKYRYA
jgi:hypothetical protein